MDARLNVLHHDRNVKQLKLLPTTVIGRSKECDLKIASVEVSRVHCRITVRDDGVYLEDLGSSNGTLVNDKLLKPHCPIAVQPGTKLTIGPAEFLVDYVAPASNTVAILGSSEDTIPIPRISQSPANGDERKLIRTPKVALSVNVGTNLPTEELPPDQSIASNKPPTASTVPEINSFPPPIDFEEAVENLFHVDEALDFDFSDPIQSTTSAKPPSKSEKSGGLRSIFSMFGRKPKPSEKKSKTPELTLDGLTENPEPVANSSQETSPFDFAGSIPPSNPETSTRSDNETTDDNDFQKFLQQF